MRGPRAVAVVGGLGARKGRAPAPGRPGHRRSAVKDQTGKAEQVELKPGRSVRFTLLGERAVKETFSGFSVAEDILLGVVGDGTLALDLRRVTSAEVSWVSPGRTVALVLGVIGGSAGLTAAVWWLVSSAIQSLRAFGGNWRWA